MLRNIPSQMTRVLVLTVGVLAAGVVAGAPQDVALTPLAASAGQVEANAGAGPRPGCIGASFGQGRANRTLESTKAISSGNYLVRMQPNGDLVLREISSGRACWASGTRAPGDASATFDDIQRDVVIESASRGVLRRLNGSGDGGLIDNVVSNASVNDKGEFLGRVYTGRRLLTDPFSASSPATMPTSRVGPNGHRSLQTSSYEYLAVLGVEGGAVQLRSTSTPTSQATQSIRYELTPKRSGLSSV